MRTRGAGERKSFKQGQGEIGEGELSGQGELLSFSFTGDSTSLSPIWMSVLILCAKGGDLRERGHLEKQEGDIYLHFGGSLGRPRQPAGVGHRLEQPGAMTHF